MVKMFSIICTAVLAVAACDEAELLEEEVGGEARDGDEGDRPGSLVPAARPASAGSCATLHEHINFGGDRYEIDRGAYVPWIGNLWNDQVSSLDVQPGCVLNAYEHINFGGKHATFQSSVPWVGDDWNDLISSYICTC